MLRNPLVSVIIPCYNCERFVEKAIRSIMNQSYKNLEIIITDDCSTDNTYKILQELAALDERIVLYKNPENYKLVKTLNFMVGVSKGEYIARMDSDDISLPDRIEMQVKFMEHNSGYDVCGTGITLIDESDKVFSERVVPEKQEDIKKIMPYYNCLAHPTILAKANVLKENLYDNEYSHTEDYELWCRLIYKHQCCFYNIRKAMLMYRITNNQVCQLNREEQHNKATTIIKKYSLVDKQYLDAHMEIFFQIVNNELKKKDLKKYIDYVYEYFTKECKNYLFTIMPQILKTLIKRKMVITFIKYACTLDGQIAMREILTLRMRKC